MNASHAVTVPGGTPVVPVVTPTSAVVTVASTPVVTVAGQRDSHGVTPPVTVAVPGQVTPDVTVPTVTVPLPLSRLSRRDSPGRAVVTHRDSVTSHDRDTVTIVRSASVTAPGHNYSVHVVIGTRVDGTSVTAVVPIGRDNLDSIGSGTGKSRIVDWLADAERSSVNSETVGGF